MKKRVHALLSLTLIEGLGPVKLKHLLEKKGSPITFLNSFSSSIKNEVKERADEINEEVKALQYSQILGQTCEERTPRQTKISQKLTISVNAERHLGNRKSST